MNDVICPYCEHGQEINHDDGYGYEEDALHSQQCSSCGKNFIFTTAIIYSYEAVKADCLNGAPHKYKPSTTFPIEWTKMVCIDCGDEREPTKEEFTDILKNTKSRWD